MYRVHLADGCGASDRLPLSVGDMDLFASCSRKSMREINEEEDNQTESSSDRQCVVTVLLLAITSPGNVVYNMKNMSFPVKRVSFSEPKNTSSLFLCL